MTDERVRLDVALECGGETIRGTVKDGGGTAVEFSGWLGLMSAFDSACLRARRGAASEIDNADDEGSSIAP